jgi:hypothetical protein
MWEIGTRCVKKTLSFESRLLLLEILEVDVLEILRQLILYATIDKSKTSNTHKISKTE